METFTEPRPFVKNHNYWRDRHKVLSALDLNSIDRPITDLITRINRLSFCFTLQSCFGHFILKPNQNDHNLELTRERSITCIEAAQDENLGEFDELLSASTVIIDALFGTCKVRPLGGTFSEVLDRVSQSKKQNPNLHVVALDLPSGLDADNGAVDPACPYADITITLGFFDFS